MQLPEELIQDAWRVNLDTYVEYPAFGFRLFRWQRKLAQLLTQLVLGGKQKLVITAPPRHGKSELISRWLTAWYLDLFPHHRIILASYAETLARFRSEQVRNHFLIHKDHTLTRISPDHAQAADWHTTLGGGLRAVGVDGSITGFGGHLIVIDDPHKDWASVQSGAQRQKVIDWYKATLSTRAEPGASTVLIQTRWHERDLAGYLLNSNQGWKEIRLPALAEEHDWIDRKPGQALCPQRYTAAELHSIRESVGSIVFDLLYQQRARKTDGKIVKRDWIRYWTPDSLPPPEQFHSLIASWDTNLGEVTEGGSYVVGQVWAATNNAYYLLDQVRGRFDYMRLKKEVRKLDSTFNRPAQYIEAKAAGVPLINEMRNEIPGVIGVVPKQSKAVRFQVVAPLFESGSVYLPHQSVYDWVPGLVEELVNFPDVEHDDQVDACSQALRVLHSNANIRTREIDLSVLTLGQRASPWQAS